MRGVRNASSDESIRVGRPQSATDIEHCAGHSIAATKEVTAAFEGYSYLTNDMRRMEEIAREVVAIRQEYACSIEANIKIGMHLLAIRNNLGDEQIMEAFVTRNILPFKRSYATKLMTVARDFMNGRFDAAVGRRVAVNELPPLAVAYELRTLTDRHLKKAAEKGLISPNTTVASVREYRQEIKAEDYGAPDASTLMALRDLHRWETKRGRLSAQVAELDIKIKKAKRRLRRHEVTRPVPLGFE